MSKPALHRAGSWKFVKNPYQTAHVMIAVTQRGCTAAVWQFDGNSVRRHRYPRRGWRLTHSPSRPIWAELHVISRAERWYRLAKPRWTAA